MLAALLYGWLLLGHDLAQRLALPIVLLALGASLQLRHAQADTSLSAPGEQGSAAAVTNRWWPSVLTYCASMLLALAMLPRPAALRIVLVALLLLEIVGALTRHRLELRRQTAQTRAGAGHQRLVDEGHDLLQDTAQRHLGSTLLELRNAMTGVRMNMSLALEGSDLDVEARGALEDALLAQSRSEELLRAALEQLQFCISGQGASVAQALRDAMRTMPAHIEGAIPSWSVDMEHETLVTLLTALFAATTAKRAPTVHVHAHERGRALDLLVNASQPEHVEVCATALGPYLTFEAAPASSVAIDADCWRHLRGRTRVRLRLVGMRSPAFESLRPSAGD